MLVLIIMYVTSCGSISNKGASELWNDGQKYRTKDKIKDSITSYQTIITQYPSDNFAPRAQFQIADIYLNDVKDYEFAVQEFKKVVDAYPGHEFSKKSLFMIGYIYNNYLHAYSDAIITYQLFSENYPNDELMPSVEYELEGLKGIQSTIDSLNSIVTNKTNL